MLSKYHRQLSRMPLGGAFFAPPPSAERSCPASCFLVNCGIERTETKPSYFFDNRTRNSFCLLQYTIEGEGAFDDLADGRTIALPPGTAFLITAPSQTRYRLSEGGSWRQAYALFSGVAAFHHCRRVIESCGWILDLTGSDPESGAVLQSLCAVNEHNGQDNTTERSFFSTSALTYQLLMRLRLYADSRHAPLNRPAAESLAPALALIESNYPDSGLGVEELAASCGYSRYHFTRLFHSLTGTSPQALLIKTRLKHALRLLTGSDLPAKQVATRCGINDYSYFCLLFKRNYGLTPGSIRRNNSPQ